MSRLTAFLRTRSPFGIESKTVHYDQASLIGAWSAALLDGPGTGGLVDVSLSDRLPPGDWTTSAGRLVLLPGAALALPKVKTFPDVVIASPSDSYGVAPPITDRNNPFDVAAAAPTTVLAVRLHQLMLPRRAINVFMNAGLETVGDVLALGFDGLMKLRNFGTGSVQGFAQALDAFVGEGGLDAPSVDASREAQESETGLSAAYDLVAECEADSATGARKAIGFDGRFHDAFLGALRRLAPRDAVVLSARLGYGGPAQKLEDIGASLGVTRERARQLEKRAVDTIARQDWQLALQERVGELLNGRHEPLYLDLIAAEDARFDGFQDNLDLLGRIIVEFSDESLHVWPLNDRLIASRLSEDVSGSLRQRILTHLESQLSTKLTPSETRLIVESICAGSGAPELAAFVCEALEPYLHYSQAGAGPAHLVAVGRGLRPALLSIFDESDLPLHLRQVRERLVGRGYEATNSNSLRAAVRAAGMLLFGRSTYGTIRHLGLDANTIADLRDELIEIVGSEPDHQWHAAELLEELQRRGIGPSDGMDQYTVGALLDGVSSIAYLGRLVWTAKQKARLSPSDRREVGDLVEAVLVDAGRPLSKAELRRAIQRARGLNTHFLPQATERVIRLGGGRWGLTDRDCRMPPELCEASLRALESVLFRRGRALHITELSSALAERGIALTEEAIEELFGRAQVDPRFRVARGNFVALPGWDSLGRSTMSEAQEQVLERLRAPMTLDEIQGQLEAITERPINRWHVASWLNRSGTSFDPSTGTWVLSDDPQDSDVEE